jgi:hypothetical protein
MLHARRHDLKVLSFRHHAIMIDRASQMPELKTLQQRIEKSRVDRCGIILS